MEKTITLEPLDDTAADLLHTAVVRLAGKVDNKKHADLLRRVATSLEQPTHTVGELDPLGGFLLQTAARMLAAQTANTPHAAILHRIALDLSTKIHAK